MTHRSVAAPSSRPRRGASLALDERSMRVLELCLAGMSIVAVILLAVVR
jgi:hypothetical protein